MKKYIIINKTKAYIINRENMVEARKAAIDFMDHSNETAIREITEIEDLTVELDIKELKTIHEDIRTVLMENNCEEYGDCIIDDICNAIGIPTTIEYYEEGK